MHKINATEGFRTNISLKVPGDFLISSLVVFYYKYINQEFTSWRTYDKNSPWKTEKLNAGNLKFHQWDTQLLLIKIPPERLKY